MVKMFKRFVKTILLPEDNKYIYGEYQGSINFVRSLVWNIIHPGRIISRFRFGVLFFNPRAKKRLFRRKLRENDNKYSDKNHDQFLYGKFSEFIDTGGVVIDGYFPEQEIDDFLNKHSNEIESLKKNESANENQYQFLILSISEELINIWLNRSLLTFLECFFNRVPLARYYPCLALTTIKEQFTSREITEKGIVSKVADGWHVDHSTLFNLHVLLNDITEDDAHMEFLRKTHLLANQAAYQYSPEEIERYNFEITKCVGKKGTIYMHYGNTLHRLNLKLSEKERLALHFEFTAGANILFDCNNLSACLNSNYKIDELDNYRREVLRGIFPKSLVKGYEAKNNYMIPNKFNGI